MSENFAKKAKLLGFKNYADYSIETKMAKSTEEVLNFLNNLVDRAKKYAINEIEELKEFAFQTSGINNLEAYDILYYSEKLKQQKFSISQEELRRYFPVKEVINKLKEIKNENRPVLSE